MTTKKKIFRTFLQTKKYNEYMKKYYEKKRLAEGKSYTPRVPIEQQAEEPQVDTSVAQRALEVALEKNKPT